MSNHATSCQYPKGEHAHTSWHTAHVHTYTHKHTHTDKYTHVHTYIHISTSQIKAILINQTLAGLGMVHTYSLTSTHFITYIAI